MLKIRLQRVGRKNNPSFRVVLTESRNAADGGKFQEILGSYNPHVNTAQLKTERISYWISQGVQPSDTVHNLLVHEGVVEGKKINVLPKKRPIIKEQVEEEDKKDEKQDTAEAQNEAEGAEETPAGDGGEDTKAEAANEQADSGESEGSESGNEDTDAADTTSSEENTNEEVK